METACARFEYFVWHSALTLLADTRLDCHTLLPPRAPPAPWRDGDVTAPRIVAVCAPPTGAVTQHLPLKPQRERARQPLRSPACRSGRRGAG
jgi:hypothetical protein